MTFQVLQRFSSFNTYNNITLVFPRRASRTRVYFDCSSGDGSPYLVPLGSWARVPMPGPAQKACYKVCQCTARGLARCQPLPCVALDNCRLHDKVMTHGKRCLGP